MELSIPCKAGFKHLSCVHGGSIALSCGLPGPHERRKEEKKKLDSFRSHTRGAACACEHNI